MTVLNIPAPRRIMVLDSFITGTGECAAPADLERLRAGAPLALRRAAGRRRMEVWTTQGRPLGYLPAEDAETISEAAMPDAPLTARVAAVVPAFRRPRIQLRVTVALAMTGEDRA
jgi:hypothetical protein